MQNVSSTPLHAAIVGASCWNHKPAAPAVVLSEANTSHKSDGRSHIRTKFVRDAAGGSRTDETDVSLLATMDAPTHLIVTVGSPGAHIGTINETVEGIEIVV